MRDETFGPVLSIAVVAGADEAIARANASRYGLTASLWTKDRKRALVLAQKLRAGVVTINNHGFTGALPAAPWSGHGETGWGITGSPLALDMLTRPRFLLVDSSRGKSELWWYPYTPALRNVASAMATLRCSTNGIFRARGRAVPARGSDAVAGPRRVGGAAPRRDRSGRRECLDRRRPMQPGRREVLDRRRPMRPGRREVLDRRRPMHVPGRLST